jgi:hypothetical protein
MRKELEIAQVNELKFYLNWDYVKDICNKAITEENQQLKEKLEKAEATLLEIDGGWVTDEIRSKISEYFVYAIGEKK